MRTRLPLLAALAALLATPTSRAQTDEDARWSDAFGIPDVKRYNPDGSIDGYARALAVAPNGDVYVGGFFPEAGGVEANHIARWDGHTWHTLGVGITATTFRLNPGDYYWATPVQAIAPAPSGGVYVGGRFSSVGGSPASNVARWTGSAWSTLGAGLPGMVTALTLGPDGALYAGYGSTILGNQGTPNVARWDGTTWTPLAEADGDIRALLFGPDGALYVGGEFQTIGGTSIPYLARWSGSAWSAVGAGITGCSAVRCGVFALAQYGGQLYVGGEFNQVGTRRADRVARWTGAEWFGLLDGGSFGPPRRVEGLALDAGGVYAAMMKYVDRRGQGVEEPYGIIEFYTGPSDVPDTEVALAHWTGAEWTDLSPVDVDDPSLRYVRNGLYGIALRDDEVIVAGYTYVVFGSVGRYIKSEGRWVPLGGTKANGLLTDPYTLTQVEDLATGPDGTVYATGVIAFAGDTPVRNIAAWDGANWQDVGGGREAHLISALGLAPTGELYVAAYTQPQFQTHIWIWNGTTWRSSGRTNDLVNGIEFGPSGEVYVALGWTLVTDEDGDEKIINSCVAMLENGEWTEVGDPTNPYLRYVAQDVEIGPDGRIYAAWSVFGESVVGVWDGSTWTTLADEFEVVPPTESVGLHALALAPNGDLYVGGQFGRVEGQPANGLARWDGTQWSRVGSGFAYDAGSGGLYPGTVDALIFLNGALYVGGTFNRVYQNDGTVVEATGIVRWDGTQFEALGRGLGVGNGGITSIATYGDSLYVGGYGVTSAGPYTSLGIARYYDGDLPPVGTEDGGRPVAFALDAPYPNPARGGVIRLRYGLATTGAVRLDAFDVLGRRVAVLAEGEGAAGWHEAVLDVRSLASGVYVVRLNAGERVLTRRVTVVR